MSPLLETWVELGTVLPKFRAISIYYLWVLKHTYVTSEVLNKILIFSFETDKLSC